MRSYDDIDNYKDSVVIDIDSDNRIFVKDNLNQPYNFQNDYDYKNFIKKYVSSIESRLILFQELNYITIKKIIDKFEQSASYNDYELVVTPRLLEYVDNKNLEVEKRKDLGTLIKRQDNTVYDEFIKFKTSVLKEMERELRDKQMWDSFFMVKMWKSANYSVPGAGKTSIVYGAFSYLNSSKINKVDKLLVVGPMNSFKAWKDEFKKCFGEKKKLNLLNVQDPKYRNASERIANLRFDSGNCNLILVNYEMLPNLEDVLTEIIDDRTMLVYDEVHKVKGINRPRANSALAISKKAKYKVILTGTPIPNSYADLYNQLNILFTDEYKTFFKFDSQTLQRADATTINRINESIYPFFSRTTKKQLNIPAPNPDEKIIVHMDDREQKLFSMLREKYSYNGLALFIRLLQASCNPKLLLKNIDSSDFQGFFTTDEEEVDEKYINLEEEKYCNTIPLDESENKFIKSFDMTGKFWRGIELIKCLVNEGKTVIVWGIFVDTIERIKEELDNLNISSDIIYGKTPLKERENKIEQFKAQEFKVLITNPHTLAESVSLHETCHDAIYFEYSFNLTHMLQSRDRINRLGLKNNQYTQYYYLFLINSIPEEDSIDLRTYNRLKEKEDIMLKSIESDIIQSINFDIIDDLKRILEKD